MEASHPGQLPEDLSPASFASRSPRSDADLRADRAIQPARGGLRKWRSDSSFLGVQGAATVSSVAKPRRSSLGQLGQGSEQSLPSASSRSSRGLRFGGEEAGEQASDPNADLHFMSDGLPSPLWRAMPFSHEDKSVNVPRNRGPGIQLPRAERKGKSKRRQQEQDQQWQHAKEKPPEKYVTDHDYHSAVEVLKAQSGMHSANVSDRFRFAADMSLGSPIVIKGAGTSSGMHSSAWASDYSALCKFHSGATRLVQPNSLQPFKPDPAEKKKKKKKEGDIDHLQMSDTGFFRPLYPIDKSLMTIRRLKRSMEPVEKPKLERRPKKEENQMHDFSGFKQMYQKSAE
jgi:hypothetical protein